MHFSLITLLTLTTTTLALTLPTTNNEARDSAAPIPACTHNGDAARWIDPLSPADRLSEMCRDGTICHQANGMQMCVNGDRSLCQTAIEMATDWQSYLGDWFLWSVVQCGALSVTINGD